MIVTELAFLSILTTVNAIIGRCYLCSQDTLAECIGSNQPDRSTYLTVLQYYTEPCNGQCVLFRNENRSIIRGCSWTYGHMIRKSIGWHEISPGINAYFCDSHLCNNGTYDQPSISQWIFSPQQLFLSAENNPSLMQIGILGGYLSRQFGHCYSCTARFQGCGEFLDPHYAPNYIRSCPSSCIIFRNPHDLNLITRDCSIFWPQIHAKTGFHKMFGSDAFFCQESLCNGISFDLIMGIFHNQLPAVIAFHPIKNIPITSTASIYHDNVTSVDQGLNVESTIPTISDNSTTEYFDCTNKTLPNNATIIDNLAGKQVNVSLNSSDLNDTTVLLSSTMISSTIQMQEEKRSVTRFEHLSVNDNIEEINQTDKNITDYLLPSSVPIIDFFTFIPYFFLNNQTKDQLFEYIKSLSKPSFSWILNITESQSQNSTTTTTTTTTTSQTPRILYEYCKNKQCHHNGHLNSDCLCICLPTFTGDNCETVLCEEEPADICAFVLEHECKIDYIRYLCPKYCQIDICPHTTN